MTQPRAPYLVRPTLDDSTPDWFLRTLQVSLCDFELLATWLTTNPPLPNPHQQQSWPWIVEQAWRHRALTDAAAREPWPVPSETLSRHEHPPDARTAATMKASLTIVVSSEKTKTTRGSHVVVQRTKARRSNA